MIAPHKRQWCFRLIRLNDLAQLGHSCTSASGIHETIDLKCALKNRNNARFRLIRLGEKICFVLHSRFESSYKRSCSMEISLSSVMSSLLVCITYRPMELSRYFLNSDVSDKCVPSFWFALKYSLRNRADTEFEPVTFALNCAWELFADDSDDVDWGWADVCEVADCESLIAEGDEAESPSSNVMKFLAFAKTAEIYKNT